MNDGPPSRKRSIMKPIERNPRIREEDMGLRIININR